MKRQEVVEFYIEQPKERNIVKEFQDIFELGMTGVVKSMREDLHGQIDSLVKSGEGSRGGRVIGHTKSGKPIYAEGNSDTKGWSSQDHMDASEKHDHQTVAVKQGDNDKGKKGTMNQHHSEIRDAHSRKAYAQERAERKLKNKKGE